MVPGEGRSVSSMYCCTDYGDRNGGHAIESLTTKVATAKCISLLS